MSRIWREQKKENKFVIWVFFAFLEDWNYLWIFTLKFEFSSISCLYSISNFDLSKWKFPFGKNASRRQSRCSLIFSTFFRNFGELCIVSFMLERILYKFSKSNERYSRSLSLWSFKRWSKYHLCSVMLSSRKSVSISFLIFIYPVIKKNNW